MNIIICFKGPFCGAYDRGKFSSSKSRWLLIVGNLCQQFSKHNNRILEKSCKPKRLSTNGTSLKMEMLELVRDIIKVMR